jgi:hypothetical protein
MMPRRAGRTLPLLLAVVALFALGGCATGGQPSTSTPTPVVSSTSPDGQALVSAKCTRCHPINRIQAARKTRDKWTATVARMQSHGLKVTGQERAAIIDYLTKRDGGK